MVASTASIENIIEWIAYRNGYENMWWWILWFEWNL